MNSLQIISNLYHVPATKGTMVKYQESPHHDPIVGEIVGSIGMRLRVLVPREYGGEVIVIHPTTGVEYLTDKEAS